MAGYALDLWSPAQHVFSELERAAPAALSLDELSAGYRHVLASDLYRVRLHEGCETDTEATRKLVEMAIEEGRRNGKNGREQIISENGGYRLADGLTWDKIRFWKRALVRTSDDPHARFHDPFNPLSGAFSENVRRETGKDAMEELRQSMQSYGWVKEFPAIKDEKGVVLVGHRRLAVAADLGIEPVVKTIRLGDGDAADAERFKLAIVSNLGGKPFTKEERARLAAYLYGEREWTMEKIANALNVTAMTVSRDLSRVSRDVKSKERGGRPRKFTKDEEQELGRLVFDEGIAMHKAQAIVRPAEPERSWPTKAAITAIERERGRREERENHSAGNGGSCTCPNCGHIHSRSDAAP